MATTHQCDRCPRQTTDTYPSAKGEGHLCRDCHEARIRRSTMECVYRDDDTQRAMESTGVRVIRKKL